MNWKELQCLEQTKNRIASNIKDLNELFLPCPKCNEILFVGYTNGDIYFGPLVTVCECGCRSCLNDEETQLDIIEEF